MRRVRYTFKAPGGRLSVMQEGRDDLWRIRFGDVPGTEYSSAEGAVFALSNMTARIPAGLRADDWKAPSGLSSWKRDIVDDDVPPREQTDGSDDW